MRIFGYFRLHVLTVGAMFLLSPLAALCGSMIAHSGFAGVYRSVGRNSANSMSVSLGADGTATVVEDAGSGAMTLFGRWVDDGNQIKVTFTATEGEPQEPPMVFEPSHEGLQAVTWNHAVWGKQNPPAMKKGYKVKASYWFTTVR